MPARRRRQKGEGPVWDWIKKQAKMVKDKKLISRGLAAAASLGTAYSPGLTTASNIASTIGLGKRKRKRGPGRRKKPGRPKGS